MGMMGVPAGLEDMASVAGAGAYSFALPPAGSTGDGNMNLQLIVNSETGKTYVRLIYARNDGLTVIDLPTDMGPEHINLAEHLGEMIAQNARQGRSGLVVP